MATEIKKIILKKGLEKDLPALSEGELGFSTDAKNLYIGSDDGNRELYSGISPRANKIVIKSTIENGDLLVAKASPNENQALGFYYANFTNATLSGGIAKFTATAQWGRLEQSIPFNAGDKIYYFANFKSDSPLVSLMGVTNKPQANTYHSGSGNFEFKSNLQTTSGTFNKLQITDHRTSDWTPIEVDYMGAINLTATFGAGKEPSKELMDKILDSVGGFIGENGVELDLLDILKMNTIADTGWQELTLINGVSGTIKIRKIGDICYMKGEITVNTYIDNINCSIPTAFRPDKHIAIYGSTVIKGQVGFPNYIVTIGSKEASSLGGVYIGGRDAGRVLTINLSWIL